MNQKTQSELSLETYKNRINPYQKELDRISQKEKSDKTTDKTSNSKK
ncbi:hypothetical protein ACLSY8_09105 [Avibacterium avium]